MGDAHHRLVEAIDGRIGFPIKRSVKFQLLFRERTEFLCLSVGYRNRWLWLFFRLCRFWLTLWLADRLQFSEKIVGEQTRVRIIIVIRATRCFYFLIGWYWGWRWRWIIILWCRRRFWRFWLGRVRFRLILWLRSVALHRLFLHLRVFQLLTYSDAVAGSDQFGQIHIESMVRKSCQLYATLVTIHTASKGNSQNLRRFDRIHTHALVEVTDTEKKNGIRVFLLHLPILLHQRSIRYTLRFFDLIFRGSFYRFRRWRFRC